jgi:hypothetical protein
VRRETPNVLGPLEIANLNHWTKSKNPVILSAYSVFHSYLTFISATGLRIEFNGGHL